MKGPTALQRHTLEFIAQFIGQNGYPPTRKDICEHYGIRRQAAHDRLVALQRKGFIEIVPKTSRGLRILKPCP